MLELTAAQTLIARITAIGLSSTVFTYYLVKLLVNPFLDVRLADNAYREFATNAATAVSQITTKPGHPICSSNTLLIIGY